MFDNKEYRSIINKFLVFAWPPWWKFGIRYNLKPAKKHVQRSKKERTTEHFMRNIESENNLKMAS